MERIRSGFDFIFSSYKRAAAVLFIFALLLAIPVTISFIGQQQDIRQRASEVCSNVAADIMLVIDKSGSMSGAPLIAAKTAAKSFVDVVAANANNRVGVVSFSNDASTSLDSPLTNSFSSVKTTIDFINSSGETCTQCGIKKANNEIAADKRNGIKNVVILLTDGRANRVSGSSTTDFDASSKAALDEVIAGNTANQTVYFTIGLGKDIKADFLQQIANSTGGKYFTAPTADDLQSIYQQISQIVGKGSISGFVYNDTNGNGVLDAGEQKLQGWEADLKNSNNQIFPFTTDESGGFSFSGICDNSYTLSIKPQEGWTITSPSSGSSNIATTNGGASNDNNFGVTQNGPTSTPACTTRPACLDATPRCLIAEPIGGWCPVTPTPTQSASQQCALYSKGDANCDGKIDMDDFNIWRDEFLKTSTSKTSDFNNDGVINTDDFNIWRDGFLGL